MTTDVLIIGAGPAGIFTALGLLGKGDTGHITMVDRGLPIERRSCPKERVGHCVGCRPCRITTGFSGAGAFSDGKLSLSYEVGGDLPELIGADLAQRTIERADNIYLQFGADSHVEGLEHPEKVAEIRRRAIRAGRKLVDCPIRHLGTERAQQSSSSTSAWTCWWRRAQRARSALAPSWLTIPQGSITPPSRSEPHTPSSPQGVVVQRGWTSSASVTASTTRAAPWTWACASRCETRSWTT